MIKYIAQKDAHGCAVACLAMVTGSPYEHVKAYFSGKDIAKDGIQFFDYVEYLVDNGYACNWKWPNAQAKGLNVPREQWPPEFWAAVNIVIVMSKNGQHRSHAIVVKRNGDVLDPYNPNIKTYDAALEHFKEVSQVIGVYNVAME